MKYDQVLDYILAQARHNAPSQALMRVYDAVRRIDGVFAEQGSRAWAYVMLDQGKRVRRRSWEPEFYLVFNPGGLDIVNQDGARHYPTHEDGWELAPVKTEQTFVVVTSVPAWVACKAYHEDLRVRCHGTTKWQRKSNRQTQDYLGFGDQTTTYDVEYLANQVPL